MASSGRGGEELRHVQTLQRFLVWLPNNTPGSRDQEPEGTVA
jgi:hypothetical protein